MKWRIIAERLESAQKAGQQGRKVAIEVTASNGVEAKALGNRELKAMGLERLMTITSVTKK